jgi:hypothetical protein
MGWLWLVPLAVAIASTAAVAMLATRAAREALQWHQAIGRLGPLRGELGALGAELRAVTDQYRATSERAAAAEDRGQPPVR